MIHDALLMMSEDQAVTSTSSNASTNSIDLDGGLAKDAWGTEKRGDPGASELWLNVVVTTTVESSGAATVTFALQHSTDDSSWSNTIIVTAAIGKATLVAGYNVIRVPLPRGLNRYVQMNYAVATAALTAGAFSAWIGMSSASD
jgi:hypothetical protein